MAGLVRSPAVGEWGAGVAAVVQEELHHIHMVLPASLGDDHIVHIVAIISDTRSAYCAGSAIKYSSL